MVIKTPNPVDVRVGGLVRMRRVLIGMSQSSLGEALGVTFQQIQKYEKGANRIGASRMQQISVVLGVPVAFFFEASPESERTQEGSDARPPDVAEFFNTVECIRLNKAFVRIADPQVRRKIVALITALANAEIKDEA